MVAITRTPTQTINLLRAFSSGGYADINKLNAWNMDFVQNTPEGSKYRQMASKIEDTLRFMTVSVSVSPRYFALGKTPRMRLVWIETLHVFRLKGFGPDTISWCTRSR